MEAREAPPPNWRTDHVNDHYARRQLAAAAQAALFRAEPTVLLARRSSMPIVIWEKP